MVALSYRRGACVNLLMFSPILTLVASSVGAGVDQLTIGVVWQNRSSSLCSATCWQAIRAAAEGALNASNPRLHALGWEVSLAFVEFSTKTEMFDGIISVSRQPNLTAFVGASPPPASLTGHRRALSPG